MVIDGFVLMGLIRYGSNLSQDSENTNPIYGKSLCADITLDVFLILLRVYGLCVKDPFQTASITYLNLTDGI